MSKTVGLFSSSLGRKMVMGITGLFLASFLVIHLIGNLALFYDPVAFNEYTKFMSSNALIRVMEIVLVLGFGSHIIDAILLTKANNKARPVKYAMDKKKSSWYSRNMGLTGSVILVFLVIHIGTYFVPYKLGDPSLDATGLKDMYTIVVNSFQQWWYSLLYIVSFVVLGAHLNHGFQSAFQTLGVNHPKYTPFIQKVGVVFSILITIGFISFPIYFGFIK
ncbi:MAG: succinate dehydrogenase cytochrome b subunit [Flavobacteriales bacterium]|jgi:succinate dehydrogenase / fumarate reductase cytochrome b subunit|nr:succinate dehydrogenase cytochrome b subunit [Flavobacteriales bacterium]